MMLNLRRIDIVPCARSVANSILASLSEEISGIKEVVEFEQIDIHVFLHKKHKELAQKLSETIDTMKADGSFQKIYKTAGIE